MKRTPLNRKSPLRRTPFFRKPAKKSQVPPEIRDAVTARSGGLCEWPSCPNPATDLHHKQMRSQGGKHTVDNLAHLCRGCHDRIHANPAQSYEAGWLIRGRTT